MSSLRRRVLEANATSTREAPRRPPPSHRHNSPSAPWPWVDLHDDIDPIQLASALPPVPPPCDHTTCEGSCWKGYPQSRFPNWTPAQVRRSRIYHAVNEYNRATPSKIYHVDVDTSGLFTDAGTFEVTEDGKTEFWEKLVTEGQGRPENVRVRAVFVDKMSGPVLQMLGAKYNIEPFFFSSSLGWIPSRYQEEVRPQRGDHITLTLTFVRTMDHPDAKSLHTFPSGGSASGSSMTMAYPYGSQEQIINTQAPLFLHSSDHYLILDLLAVHLIRSTEGNTIISYHHSDADTSATYLHERIRFAGQSVYWQNIFQKSPDPTFVLMTFIWHAMYAWDEALEHLYSHICYIEAQVINTSNPHLTRELHAIRAHLLYYSELLQDFRKAVAFVRDVRNPAMDADSVDPADRFESRQLLERECRNLLGEIERLEMSRNMQDKRLKNVMNLVFSSVNIDDSKRMKELTEAAVRDSAAMKQIAYLSMIFLPASFVAAIFGMNLREIVPGTNGSLAHYFETMVPLTFATIWGVMIFQSKYLLGPEATFWMRVVWPVTLVQRMIRDRKGRSGFDADAPLGMQELPWGQRHD